MTSATTPPKPDTAPTTPIANQRVASTDESSRYVAAVLSVAATVVLISLMITLVSELFARGILNTIITLLCTMLVWSGALNGLMQFGRFERPPQLGKKWINIGFGFTVISGGLGIFVRDALPNIAIGLSKARDLGKANSQLRGDATAEKVESAAASANTDAKSAGEKDPSGARATD